MALSILQVAKALGELSGWKRSNLELQKMAYMAEMIYLGRTGLPLTDSNFQAWDRGPVNPDLYHWAKMFGSQPVPASFFKHIAPVASDGVEMKAIRDAFKPMAKMSPWRMVDLTHQANGAWAEYYEPRKRGVVIPKSRIRAEYDVRVTEED